MIVIDTNSLIILILGLIDPNLIDSHKRTSIYERSDYEALLTVIKDFKNIKLIPNVLTEADNLLNDLPGNLKEQYLTKIAKLMSVVKEEYIQSLEAPKDYAFRDLGLTDTLALKLAESCELLITSDSMLSDYAKSRNINVFDLVQYKNEKLKNGNL